MSDYRHNGNALTMETQLANTVRAHDYHAALSKCKFIANTAKHGRNLCENTIA